MVLRADHQVAPTRSTPAPAPSIPTQNRHFEPPTLLQRSAQRWSESRALRVPADCLRPPCPTIPSPCWLSGPWLSLAAYPRAPPVQPAGVQMRYAPLSPWQRVERGVRLRSLGQGTRPARLRGQRSEQEFLAVLSRSSFR